MANNLFFRVEGENTRLRHYLARLHRKTLCYSKSREMLRHSIRLLIHYLKFGDVPVPALHPLIQQRPFAHIESRRYFSDRGVTLFVLTIFSRKSMEYAFIIPFDAVP